MTTTTESSVMQPSPGAAYTVQLGPSLERAPDVLPNPASPATPDNGVIQLGAQNGLPPSLALKQLLTKTEPKYLDSFGSPAFESQIAVGLKIIGWRVIGTAQRIWADLENSLAELVTSKRQELELQRPSGNLANPVWMLRCFLLGPDKDRATPHVVVLCAAKWLRQGIGRLIVRSRLLVTFKFKCCALPFIAELDMAPASSPSSSPASTPTPSVRSESPISIHTPSGQSNPIWHALVPVELTEFSPNCCLNGTQFEVLFQSSLGDVVRKKATIGGVVSVVHNQVYGMTACHVFGNPEDASDAWGQAAEDWTVELFDDGGDMDASGRPHASMDQVLGLQGETTNWKSEQSTNDSKQQSRPRDIQWAPIDRTWGAHDLRNSWQVLFSRTRAVVGSADAQNDWALINLEQPARNEHFVRPSPDLSADQVVIKTSSGLKYGRLESSGIFGLATDGMVAQPVMVATMSDMVQPGDSGAWAMKLQDGTFTGMLVGSCPSLGEAYLVRMDDCLREIRQQLGWDATIRLGSEDPISADGQDFETPFHSQGSSNFTRRPFEEPHWS